GGGSGARKELSGAPPADTGLGRRAVVVEVLGYLGAGLALVAGFVLGAESWAQLGYWGRAGGLGAGSVGLLAAGGGGGAAAAGQRALAGGGGGVRRAAGGAARGTQRRRGRRPGPGRGRRGAGPAGEGAHGSA